MLIAALFVASVGAAYGQAVDFERGASVREILGAARSDPAAAFESVPVQETVAKVYPPKDFTSESVKGVLRLVPGADAKLAGDDGASMALKDGEVTLKYGKPSVSAFFTRERTVAFAQGGAMAVFAAKSSQYRGFGDFSTLPTEDQPAVLKGSSVRDIVRRRLEEVRHSCTYAGYCFGTYLDTDGNLTSGYRFSAFCSGSRRAVDEVRTIRTDVAIKMLSRSSGEVLGEITTAPAYHEESSVVEYLGPCG
jgi:hypothetical protein